MNLEITEALITDAGWGDEEFRSDRQALSFEPLTQDLRSRTVLPGTLPYDDEIASRARTHNGRTLRATSRLIDPEFLSERLTCKVIAPAEDTALVSILVE